MDISSIPVESLIAIPAAIIAIYIIKKNTKKPSLVVKKTTYDRKTNKIIMHIENKKPICYSLKSAIKLNNILQEIQTEEGMSPARAINRNGGTTLIAEDAYPIIIGPNELIEVIYDPIVPRDFLDQYSLTNLDVNINFSKYEDVHSIISSEIFEGKLKERLDKLQPPKFGLNINEKRCGSSIVYETVFEYNPEMEQSIPELIEEFEELEIINEITRKSLGEEMLYNGTGKSVGRNATMWLSDLRRFYNLKISNDQKNTNDRQS